MTTKTSTINESLPNILILFDDLAFLENNEK